MTRNAGLIFKSNPLPENYMVFDGNSGQSITLEELARSRAAEDVQRFQSSSSMPITNYLRERKKENWNLICNKLTNLFNDEYDEDFLEPSQDIFKKIVGFLFEANRDFTSGMPLPTFVVADGEGGIKIEWKLNDKHLRLLYSIRRNYLYMEHNSKPTGIENFSVSQLIESLRWLNQIED
ncbi:MAG: hypothetical protein ACR2F2_13535 [Pyrinomonadaceae bacterium]